MSTSNPHDRAAEADAADLAEQGAPVTDEESVDVPSRDDVDEGDLLEQAIPVPDDDDDDHGRT
ncbi:MAG TPA: hypothetical protein VGK78_04785 [Nocardioides sp.]|uniref:hypothetical protein n=1 Tax=Nocardioides sp. TaxID=35761 RepID=UPI002F402A38